MKTKIKNNFKLFKLTAISLVTVFSAVIANYQSVSALRDITFPVMGEHHYRNDYNDPRSSGSHHAIDIFADKMTPIVAAKSGTIAYVAYPEPSWGFMVTIVDGGGYTYRYIHMNNDHPGTDDGDGTAMYAYAPYMEAGNFVRRGQLLGWVGDSGNAENTPSHLHFEMYKPNGDPMNPYNSLTQANHINKPKTPKTTGGELLPLSKSKERFVSLDMGEYDDDAEAEILTGGGNRARPKVEIYNLDNTPVFPPFFAYARGFRGGIDVAAGDVTGNSTQEIVTVPQSQGRPRVKVYTPTGILLSSFYAYNKNHKHGVRIATGDVDNDGKDEIITGPRNGGGPWVKVFEKDGTLISHYPAHSPFGKHGSEGIDVAAADVYGDGKEEIITGPNKGRRARLIVWRFNGQKISEYFPYSFGYRGGLKVSAGNVRTSTPEAEIVMVPAQLGASRIKMFDVHGHHIDDRLFAENWWRGPYDVAAGFDTSRAAVGGNRRASIWPGLD